jgi:hypothetical protein
LNSQTDRKDVNFERMGSALSVIKPGARPGWYHGPRRACPGNATRALHRLHSSTAAVSCSAALWSPQPSLTRPLPHPGLASTWHPVSGFAAFPVPLQLVLDPSRSAIKIDLFTCLIKQLNLMYMSKFTASGLKYRDTKVFSCHP